MQAGIGFAAIVLPGAQRIEPEGPERRRCSRVTRCRSTTSTSTISPGSWRLSKMRRAPLLSSAGPSGSEGDDSVDFAGGEGGGLLMHRQADHLQIVDPQPGLIQHAGRK